MKNFKCILILKQTPLSIQHVWTIPNIERSLLRNVFSLMFDEFQRMNGHDWTFSHSWLVQCSYSSDDRASKGDEARNVQILLAMVAQIQILRLHIYEYVVCANTAYSLPGSTTIRCFLCLFYKEKTNKFVRALSSHLYNASLPFCKSGTPILQKGSLGIFRTAVLWIINEQLSMPAADIVHSARIFYHRHCSAELRIWIFRGRC